MSTKANTNTNENAVQPADPKKENETKRAISNYYFLFS